ncbi:MAG: PmoA family protein [Bacteroidota bacterium]
MNIYTITAFFCVCVLWGCASSPSWTFDLEAGSHDRNTSPVIGMLPQTLHKATNLSLKNTESGQFLPVQRMASGEFYFILDHPLKAGQKRTYEISLSEQEFSPQATANIQDGRIELAVNGKSVLHYNIEEVAPPEGAPAYYRKSGFIHPIYSPGGQILTEGFPEGHMHQHGLFFAWVNTIFEGRNPDFWNQHKQSGRVSHMEVYGTISGPVFASFTSRLSHTDITAPSGPKEVLQEDWQVMVYALEDAFLFDLSSVHRCVADSPLIMPQYRYGGLGIRANSQWFEGEEAFKDQEIPNRQGLGQGGFFTSEGKDRLAGNHTRPNWVNMAGKIDGQEVGLVAMGHPGNFRFPQAVRIHPSMPYFCFAPMVTEAFSIQAGERYFSSYRFFVFNGEADSTHIDQVWKDYSVPMEIVWKQ